MKALGIKLRNFLCINFTVWKLYNISLPIYSSLYPISIWCIFIRLGHFFGSKILLALDHKTFYSATELLNLKVHKTFFFAEIIGNSLGLTKDINPARIHVLSQSLQIGKLMLFFNSKFIFGLGFEIGTIIAYKLQTGKAVE